MVGSVDMLLRLCHPSAGVRRAVLHSVLEINRNPRPRSGNKRRPRMREHHLAQRISFWRQLGRRARRAQQQTCMPLGAFQHGLVVRRWRTFGRKLDYWAIALSSTALLRAVRSVPAPLTCAAVALTPFQPFTVTACNGAAVEVRRRMRISVRTAHICEPAPLKRAQNTCARPFSSSYWVA